MQTPDGDFAGSDRFQVQRRLGAGAFGAVYQVYDREREAVVALKILRRADPTALYRFKNEFRSLADLSHPNLVTLYELLSDGEQWFFTMELVDGVSLLDYVHGGAPPRAVGSARANASTLPLSTVTAAGPDDLDYGALLPSPGLPAAAAFTTPKTLQLDRLRATLRQLAIGISVLHGAKILHRDIKPANVLVTGSGRVVLLDFGLVTEVSVAALTEEDSVVGTPAYMSPEQGGQHPLSEASDWYSTGVILYQALTGRLPFTGSILELLKAKLRHEPRPLWEVVEDTPEDLAVLCRDLLRREPRERPPGREICERLGVVPATSSSHAGLSSTPRRSVPFVGRKTELDVLIEAFLASRAGAAVTALVHCRSGVGKTALIRTFLTRMPSLEPGAVILAGRCHERESVPYKALDSLVDALTRHLTRLPVREVAALLPPDIDLLARLFPVLRQSELVDQEQSREFELSDARAVRRRAFAALKEMLTRIGDRHPLVIHIDDLQWGAADSTDFLVSLIEPPTLPHLLLLLSYRTEAHTTGALLRSLRGRMAELGTDVRELALRPLSPEESLELAEELLSGADGAARLRAREIAVEAAGSPLFVGELALFAASGGAPQGPMASSTDTPDVTLEQVFMTRVSQLQDDARNFLQLVAVAGRPTPPRLIMKAAGLDRPDLAMLMKLRVENFVRVSAEGDQENGDREVIETFHDRLRETIIGQIEPAELRGCHRSLAEVIEQSHLRDSGTGTEAVDALAYHYLGAGDEVKGLAYSLLAARRARDVYAHRNAIRHYQAAIRIMRDPTFDPEHTLPQLMQEAAATMGQAGEYDRAIELLQECLALCENPAERAELHVGLGKLYQEKGETKNAIAELERALSRLGKSVPVSLASLVPRTALQIAMHLVRPLRPSPPAQPELQSRLSKQAEVLFTLMRIYFFADIKKLVWAGFSAINLSRRLERESDRSMAYGYYGAMLFGMGILSRSAMYCERSVELADQSGDRVAEGFALERLGTYAVFANDLARAGRVLERSVSSFKEVGEMWELQTSLQLEAMSHFLSSDFTTAEALYEEMGTVARDLDAVRHQAWCYAWAPFCRYLTGKSNAAQVNLELRRAYDLSGQVDDPANQIAATMHAANLAVRVGDAKSAAELAVRTHDRVSAYRVLIPFIQVAYVDAAEAALFALEHGTREVPRSTLLRIARRGWVKAGRLGRSYPYLAGPALRIRARYVAFTVGPGAAAPVFADAIRTLEKTPNRWETAVAYHDGAVAVPERCAMYREQARRIFEQLGAEAELHRLSKIPVPAE